MRRLHEDLTRRANAFAQAPPEANYAVGLDEAVDQAVAAARGGDATAADSWINSQTGVGTSRDKVTATDFTMDGRLPFALLEQLYHNDDVSARICDLLPEQALREGFSFGDSGLTAALEELGVSEKFEQADIFARAYGGTGIVCGMGGDAATPAAGELKSLLVVDRWTIYPWEYYTDTLDPKYGTPKVWRVHPPQLLAAGNRGPAQPGYLIHESRIIMFPGARTSPRKRIANGFWDDSVLQRCYQIIQAYGLTWASVVHLLQDAAQGVYSIKELWAMIAGGNKDILASRMTMLDEQRSSERAIMIDADNEKFERVQTPFAGIPELIDRITERLASAAGTPLTVLMGSSPAGMNATGKSDLEIWYGRVGAHQRKVLTPALKKLAKLLRPAAKPEDLVLKFPSLFVPTAKETSETRYATAQADNIYFEMGVLVPAEIRRSRFTPNGWSAETTTDPTETTHIKAAGHPDMVAAAAAAAKATAVASAPAAGAKPGAGPTAPKVAEGAGTAIGTHHFSPKYGR